MGNIKKSAKRKNAVLSNLGWKKVPLPRIGMEADGAMLDLEELDGVQVIYGENGQIQFKVSGESVAPDNEETGVEEDNEEWSGIAEAVETAETVETVEEPPRKKQKKKKSQEKSQPKFDVSPLPAWSNLSIPEEIYPALRKMGYENPTQVQEQVLKIALNNETEDGWSGITETSPKPIENKKQRDIITVSPTGTGKTLAFILPVLTYIINASNASGELPELTALVLVPTRELAIQVKDAFLSLIQSLVPTKTNKRIRVAAITGGISTEKQTRQIQSGLDVLIATPGRLWDMISQINDLGDRIPGAKFLIVDEADRMIQNGHFKELENIISLTKRGWGEHNHESWVELDKNGHAVPPSKDADESTEDVTVNSTEDFEQDVEDQASEEDEKVEVESEEGNAKQMTEQDKEMRTYIFSATMSHELQVNLKRKKRWAGRKRSSNQESTTIDDLLNILDFRDEEPIILDLSGVKTFEQADKEGEKDKTLIKSEITELMVESLKNEKDLYLYYFLHHYPGKTLIFLNAIDGIRRLSPLLALLGFRTMNLHSGMAQRERLKTVDRFKSTPNAILISTDLSARGLDIDDISHVIHYQIPRSVDTFIHRSGRTARAGKKGVVLSILAPEEVLIWRDIRRAIGGNNPLSLEVDYVVLDQLKPRIKLGAEIDKYSHQKTKEKFEDDWLKKAAEEMDIEIEEDFFHPDEASSKPTHKKLKFDPKLQSLKSELADLLRQPVRARGVSLKYITTRGLTGGGFIDSLIDGTDHEGIMGVTSKSALENYESKSKNKIGASKEVERGKTKKRSRT